MKSKLVLLATILTLSSGIASYHISRLSTQTEAQKNLIAILNTIVGAGTSAVFSLMNEDETHDEDDNDQQPTPKSR